ncbi:MAG TPA: DUF2268 domain-containing putative Zn-dependent protease [Gemmatimonadaceae bacterium]|nr:DUF2268 domain-containing putative Zn-dependent protease [Gemmatimonadaceae bacterium]
MLINLLPEFFAVLQSSEPEVAYGRYLEAHRALLEAYWHNYVIEPVGPQFDDVVRDVVRADRRDLRDMLARTDVIALAQATESRCRALFAEDVDFDIIVMVGVGAANAGELVVNGHGAAFVCLEHFTSVANTSSHGLGLDPELMPMWLAHEIAHCVRYTATDSRSEFRDAVAAAGGYYSYWETGRQVTLREHLVNEGLAVHAARQFSPGHAPWEYLGYERRQFARIRELESVIGHAVVDDLDRAGLGLRLRYLSGGMSDEARTVQRHVLPERSGYYLGARMVEAAVADLGLARALRASARDLTTVTGAARTA